MTPPRKPKHNAFQAEGPLVIVGHIWRHVDNQWHRLLVRRHRSSGRSTLTELRYSRPRAHGICPACAGDLVFPSTKFVQRNTGVGFTRRDCFTCGDCGSRWWLIPE